jgi:hypothetical protein
MIAKRKNRTNFFTATPKQQYYLKQKIEKAFFNIGDDVLKLFNLRISKVFLTEIRIDQNDETPDRELFIFKDGRFSSHNMIKKFLYFKDRYFISDSVYRQLKKIIEINIPQLSLVVKLRKNLNQLIEKKIHENGVFVNVSQKISNMIIRFLSNQKEPTSFRSIKVKLSSDATNIGRFTKIIRNFLLPNKRRVI